MTKRSSSCTESRLTIPWNAINQRSKKMSREPFITAKPTTTVPPPPYPQMPNLPDDIVEEILHRLPVKSLKRFRCVAKWWCLLIDSEKFVKSHLKRSLSTNSHRRLILGGDGVYTVDLSNPIEAKPIKPPFYYQKIHGISNSCNGLVLISSDPPVLWNPFTADYKQLPRFCRENRAPAGSYWKTAYGFAHDVRNDDYKVLRIVEFRDVRSHMWIWSKSEIYSLRSNSWRVIEDFRYPLPFVRGRWRVNVNGSTHTETAPGNSGIMGFNGALHMLVEVVGAMGMGSVSVVAFDVETEEHSLFEMPEGMRRFDTKGRVVDVVLDMVGGCLSVICSSSYRIDVWVMKEYGVRESWTKLLTLRPPVMDENDTVKSLVYSEDGRKVLLSLDDMKLVWYDLKEKTAEELVVGKRMPYVFYAEAIVESLVSVSKWTVEVKKPVVVVERSKGIGRNKAKKVMRNKRDDFLSEGFKLVL